MSTVLHKLRFPDSEDPRVNAPCTVKLIGVGFVDADEAEVVQTSVLATDADGLLTMVLTPNSEIDPANSYYSVTAGGETWTFVAPDSGTAWLKDCLVVDPQPGPVIIVVPSFPGQLVAWTNAESYSATAITRDANEAIITATVVWPDGGTGTFTTDTASTLFPGAIDAYHVTYLNGAVSNTITQSLVTRDSNGAVTAQPALVVT